MSNRLINEASPYLLQHAHNPVDWYPWGDEALARAKAEDKPILLSIGYAACHWCHVMERESFEDEETARLMNEWFVPVKVDREERPDLDNVYMAAVQAMTGHGGWPMTVFLTPDGKPFFGGTYFPPEDRHGLPSFKRLLHAVEDAWRNRRAEIEEQGNGLVDYIARASSLRPAHDPLSDAILTDAARALVGALDHDWGGFGGPPKFPQPPTLEFLLRMHARGDPDALHAVTLTLDRMARGGIFDQVGGGFHRYAVDGIWLVPHFEKMLYDNGQLIRLYARAWQVTGSPLYRDTAIATGEYLLREMQHRDGGFFSSQDADSEGVEGKFYVWTAHEVRAVCGDDADLVADAFGVTPDGNWEGVSVLWRPSSDDELAGRHGVTTGEVARILARARAALYVARAPRVRPATDDKVLASWNGLAIAGLAEAGRVLGRNDFVDAAARAADFVLNEMRASGRLLRAWREGRTSGPAYLEDYALLGDGLLTLYETTFDVRWWNEALAHGRAIVELFADGERGGFYDTGSDVAAPVVRPKDLFDNALPSGNSAAADLLLRLAALSGDHELERAGVSVLRLVHRAMASSPHGFGHALGAVDRYLARAVEVAVIGDPAGDDTRALVEAALRPYLPNRVVAVAPPGATEPALVRDRGLLGDSAAAYVCRDFACRRPVADPAELEAELTGAPQR